MPALASLLNTWIVGQLITFSSSDSGHDDGESNKRRDTMLFIWKV